MCSESTNGPTVAPIEKRLPEIALGGSSGGRDGIFILVADTIQDSEGVLERGCPGPGKLLYTSSSTKTGPVEYVS